MIICLGTTPTLQRTMTFDRVEIDSVNRATQVHEFASGKSINAARVVHALGEPVLATGFLGGDSGKAIRADLDRAQIPHEFLEVEPPARMCITVIDESTGTATELIEESKPVERQRYQRLLERLASFLPSAKVLILSGTLPPGAAQRFCADCITLAGSTPVILDARGEPLDEALQRHPFLVKINRAELAHTLDADVSDDDAVRGAMRQMIARGARWIVVTAGKQPTLITNGDSFWKIETPSVRTINAIGSGDAFAAGVAVALTRGQSVPDSSTLGVACGAANAMTAHAGHVNPIDVEELSARIRVERI